MYHFECYPRALPEALDVFAQFFVAPLFKADSVGRELSAIESEFAQTRNSDAARLDECLCRAAPKDHPYSTFTWGNQESLVVEPAARGVDVQAALREMYAAGYHAANMKLCVCATAQNKGGLDELQHMVAKAFTQVRKAAVAESGAAEAAFETGAAGAPTGSKKKKKKNRSSAGSKQAPGPGGSNWSPPPLDLTNAMRRLVLVAPGPRPLKFIPLFDRKPAPAY